MGHYFYLEVEAGGPVYDQRLQKTGFFHSRFAVYRLPTGQCEAILILDPGGAVKREVRPSNVNLDLEARGAFLD